MLILDDPRLPVPKRREVLLHLSREEKYLQKIRESTGRACNFRPVPGFRPPRRDAADSTLGYFRLLPPGGTGRYKCANSSHRLKACPELVEGPGASNYARPNTLRSTETRLSPLRGES